MVVFGILFLWPWLERRYTHDYGFHNVLDRPRDAPWRTAFGAALLTWVFVIFVAGAADRIYVSFGISYGTLVWVFRVLALVLPLVVLVVTHRVCIELQRGDQVKLRQRAALARSP
jgi:ubiquinol-cytochrome c reductase cytochrome b subunit